jgi:hypothetical protein
MSIEELRDYVDQQRDLNNIPYHVYSTLIDELDNTINTIEQIKKDVLYDIYMAGVNMTGEYHGCWVRFKDIENVVNEHFRKVLEDGNDK